jgi:ribonucleotide monophosphatase NagD (HAD superfamily)
MLSPEDRLYTRVCPQHYTDHNWGLPIQPVDFSQTPISAVFVFHDPRNWGLDIQVICDIILSGGTVGAPYQRKHDTTVELVFCNPDLIWRNDFPRPRLGQGAFAKAFQAVFKVSAVRHAPVPLGWLEILWMVVKQSLTGSEYPYVQYGKPTQATYKFAEQVLLDHVEMLHGHRRLPPV